MTDDTPQNTCYLHSTPSVVPHNRTHTIFPAQVDRSFLFYLNLPGFFLTRVEVLLDLSTRVRKKTGIPLKVKILSINHFVY